MGQHWEIYFEDFGAVLPLAFFSSDEAARAQTWTDGRRCGSSSGGPAGWSVDKRGRRPADAKRTPAPVDGQRDAEDLTPARSSNVGKRNGESPEAADFKDFIAVEHPTATVASFGMFSRATAQVG
ncbi:hypothetical protein Syun_028115 [Stephania yunnanensis]|uniref:Uncharacterized protein n=1 Tax=Stephania yunnanensis TaxID=152371 RepID=A0AAP0EQP6_9MAGN